MKIGAVIRDTQSDVYKGLNKKRKKKRHRRRRRPEKEKLTFSDVENLMKHDSYVRTSGGAFRQKTWGK
ncbi:hypothetical protein [Clostridium sp. JN-9]|uniref:hypothetical protein n=1 Tax=Clostridium sp. JN-9 TaxID=2507159 RepID=UPI000FFE2350|nr:hypothetical protein [Clostridium sp. JN-9]QAT40848.1 hypothetical protein EQM05_11560 [Clostridium sp. JN-9]